MYSEFMARIRTVKQNFYKIWQFKNEIRERRRS